MCVRMHICLCTCIVRGLASNHTLACLRACLLACTQRVLACAQREAMRSLKREAHGGLVTFPSLFCSCSRPRQIRRSPEEKPSQIALSGSQSSPYKIWQSPAILQCWPSKQNRELSWARRHDVQCDKMIHE